eukprot:NODE_977_length_2666_cov_6.755022.p1 GENE.NODE_977_length_2666_cov_6.755022~~NODE_977_length_2666_cov_6.755022.p1  ORF type:complete len:788 (+),score=254.68 NODE_977_length_2666_cov_6.755022:47-2365(+)
MASQSSHVQKGIIIRRGRQFQMTRKLYFAIDSHSTVRIYKSPAQGKVLQDFRISQVRPPAAAPAGQSSPCHFDVQSTRGEWFRVFVPSNEYLSALRVFEVSCSVLSDDGGDAGETLGDKPRRLKDRLAAAGNQARLSRIRVSAATLFSVAGRVRNINKAKYQPVELPDQPVEQDRRRRKVRQNKRLKLPSRAGAGEVLGLTSRKVKVGMPLNLWDRNATTLLSTRIRRRGRKRSANMVLRSASASESETDAARHAFDKELSSYDAPTLVAVQALALGEKDSVIAELTGKLVRMARALKSLQDQMEDLSKEQVSQALNHLIDEELLDVVDERDDGDERDEGEGEAECDAEGEGCDGGDDDGDEVEGEGDDQDVGDDCDEVEGDGEDDEDDDEDSDDIDDDDGSSGVLFADSANLLAPRTARSEDAIAEVRRQIDAQVLPLEAKDDYRPAWAAASGGIACRDQALFSDTRNVVKEVTSDIGKKLMSGKLSLTSISIPIKVMQPQTSLQVVCGVACNLPFYLRKASQTSDNSERMKMVICMYMGALHRIATFKKPLCGMLGETYQGEFADGSKIFLEQVSYYPQACALRVQDPESRFIFVAVISWEPHPGLNTVRLKTGGIREVTFADGHVISFTSPTDQISGTFFGSTLKIEAAGKVHFEDSDGNSCDLVIGGVPRRHSDYFQGVLKGPNSERICKVFGTYLGYIDFDGERYWDIRHITPRECAPSSGEVLPSDSRNRQDCHFLAAGDLPRAQQAKLWYEGRMTAEKRLRQNRS